jgi:uncharacterized protein (TIGR03067 family)
MKGKAMRTIGRIVASIRDLLVAVAIAGASWADAPDETQALQGTWTAVKMELAGEVVPWMVTLTIANNAYEIVANGLPDKGSCKIDTAARPGRMIITGGKDGPNAEKTFLAIYEINGDTLRICYDLSGKKYPETFATQKGTPLYLVTYQRKK